MNVNAVAIILAAGASTRMGRPKALLPFPDRPLIEHALNVAREAGCAGTMVVLGHHADAIRTGADLGDARTIVNDDPDRGQISSIKLGLDALDFATDCALIWPVDCPLIQPDDIRALVTAYAANRASLTRIVLPSHNGERGHPMLVDLGFRQTFIDLPADQTARDVIDANPTQVLEVAVNNAGVLRDMDTPDEYDTMLAIIKERT